MTTEVRVLTLGSGGKVLGEHVVVLDGDDEKRALASANLESAYATLRSWADDARAVDAEWDTLTTAEKDVRLRVVFRRLGPFMDRLADLLAELRKG